MATKQFVEVFVITYPQDLATYETKLNKYLEEGSKIVQIHSVYHPSEPQGEIITTVVFEAEQPEGE